MQGTAKLSFSAARAKHFNFTQEYTKEMPGTNTHALRKKWK